MRRHGWAVVLGAGVGAALLVLLGVLQVRWLDRVAQTIASQKRAALHRRAVAVATDLERELTRAWLWFELEASEEQGLDESLRQRWQSWRAAGHDPGLIVAVWLAEPADEGEPRLRRLGPAAAFEATAWPPALAELRAMLGEDVRFSGMVAPADGNRAWLALAADRSRGTVLLELDGAALARELPRLAASHADELGPVLARLEDADGRPLFAPAAELRPGEHDPVLIMGMRPDLATPELLAGMQPPARPWSQRLPPPPGPGRVMRVHGGGPPPPGFALGPEPRAAVGGPMGTITFGPLGPFSAGPPGLRHRPPRHPVGLGPWRVSLNLAAGPVDDVVTSLRRRNLALAFSILTVLGGALAALAVAVRRAHALAERQRQFTASISHELRTPLAVIGSAAENLRDGTVDEPARVREYGALIHAESRRLGSMVDQTLRLAAGGALDELRRQPVDVMDVVDRAIESFAQEARARGAAIERDYPDELPPVTADPEALRQAVENVVGNALKYGGEAPHVWVRVRAVGPEVRITVEDQGMGIPRDEVDHVFEPFFRGREALDRQIRGTGLGLALVARLMRAHGGGVSVESTPGAGTTFVLRLPAEPA